ncbi:MAG: hypothetical protein R3B96_09055 [Pirellulaceae bacterium]
MSESEKESTESSQPVVGRPGVAQHDAANSSASVAEAAATNNSTQFARSRLARVLERLSRNERKCRSCPLVAVSIGIPESYYRRLWAERNPPAAGKSLRS